MVKSSKSVSLVLAEIAENEKMFDTYTNIYMLLSQFDSGKDYDDINEDLKAGKILTLDDLCSRFYDLANYEYTQANNRLGMIKNKLHQN